MKILLNFISAVVLSLCAGAATPLPTAGIDALVNPLPQRMRALLADTAATRQDYDTVASLYADGIRLSRYVRPDTVAAMQALADTLWARGSFLTETDNAARLMQGCCHSAQAKAVAGRLNALKADKFLTVAEKAKAERMAALLAQDVRLREAMSEWLANIENAWGYIKDANEAADFHRDVLMAYVRSVKGYKDAATPRFAPQMGTLNRVLARMDSTVLDFAAHAPLIDNKDSFSAWIASLRADLGGAETPVLAEWAHTPLPAPDTSADPGGALVADVEGAVLPLLEVYAAGGSAELPQIDVDSAQHAVQTYLAGKHLLQWYNPYADRDLEHIRQVVERDAEIAGALKQARELLAVPYATDTIYAPLKVLEECLLCRVRADMRPLSSSEDSLLRRTVAMLRADNAMRGAIAVRLAEISFPEVEKPGLARKAYDNVAALFEGSRPLPEQAAVRAVLNEMLAVMVTGQGAAISTPGKFRAWKTSLLGKLRRETPSHEN